MPDLAYIPDHADRAVDALLSQYQRAPRIVALVRALADGAQAVEDAGFDLLVSSTLDVASGWILDEWGRIVGERRAGLEDDAYRRFVQARIMANLSGGDTDTLIRIFEIIAGPGEIRHYDLFPAALALTIRRATPLSVSTRARVRSFMTQIKPAGVGLTLIEATPAAFQLNSGPGFDVGEFSRIL